MAKDYQYYFSQLRRIEDHREQQAEKEIRKLYRKILKETRQFVAEEYYQLAEDGKLTFEILRSKSMDARFLQEVEERLGDLSIDVSREIKRTVEEMYQLSYDGLRNAVEKGKDSKELQAFFQGVDTATAQTAWASVDNTIMDVALEKNHKNIIWDIKREVATALTVGDRFDTMADRIAGKLNGNYKKAILIARTEVGRVREAGHLASAKNLNDALQNGNSGMRMVKKWMTMRDGSVRDTHSHMNGVVAEMDDPFILPSGVKTMAPKQSGVASEDCNCRCYVSYQLMDDEEFFKATGKHFSGFDGSKAVDSIKKFVPASDIDEAAKYARETLGLEQTTAYQLGMNLDVANGLNEAIGRINDTFGSLTKSGYLDNVLLYTKKTNSYAAYSNSMCSVFLNPVVKQKGAIKKMAADAVGQFEPGAWSTGDAFHTVYHELGHAVQHMILDNDAVKKNQIDVLYRKACSDILGDNTAWTMDSTAALPLAKKAKEAGFSYYGLRNSGEFVAESIAQYYLAEKPGKIAKEVAKILKGK